MDADGAPVLRRVFAHVIIFEGKVYRNHVAELRADGSVRLFPFENEIYATEFFSGTIEIEPGENGLSLDVRLI